MTKKLIAALLSAAMLFMLFGCSGKSEKTQSAVSGDVETSAQSSAETTLESKAEASETEIYEYTDREIYSGSSNDIYGVAYIPEKDGKTPLVIISHGLGANHRSCEEYARRFAEKGYSAYVFDFPNGSRPHLDNKSGDDSTKMSVMTEADALGEVLTSAKGWDFADSEKIYLMGESQGGLVSSLVACDRPGEVAGLMLLYPAFNIPDEIHEAYQSLDEVPEETEIYDGLPVGKIYASDVWDLYVYEKLPAYTGKVVIVHGDNDSVVDISYAQQAKKTFKNCELQIISGAHHGFSGEYFEQAAQYLLDYLKENK